MGSAVELAPVSHAPKEPPRWRAELTGLFREPTGLFGEPTGQPARLTGRRVGLALLAVAGGAALSLVRQPGAGALDTVWAEDGKIFLAGAVNRGAPALTTSYAGYQHLVPRLLAVPAALVPPAAAPVMLAVSAAVCTSLLALLVYLAAAEHLPARLPRMLLAGFVVALPLAAGELPNSIANLHWAGLYAVFWVLVWTPRSRAGRIVAAAVVTLIALSDVLTLALVPLALLRLAARRDRHSAVLGTLLTGGVLVQIAGLLTGSASRPLSPDPLQPVTGYVLRVVPSTMLGERWFSTHVDARWLVLAAVAWLLVAAAVAVAVFRFSAPAWPLAAAAAAASLALYLLPVALSGVATPRYAAAPGMLLVTALVALLQPGGRLGRAPQYALATLLAAVCAANLVVDNPRAHGPQWSEELRQARVACAGGAPAVDVPIPPRDGDDWSAHLPCRYLRG
jgi:hypothetical protein